MQSQPIFPAGGLSTARLLLRPADRGYVDGMHDFYADNREHLAPWEPLRPESFYTPGAIHGRLVSCEQQMAAGTALYLMLIEKDCGELVGQCNFTNIVRGPFQACHLGFSIGARFQGEGLMHEALNAAIAYAFDELGLHRVMANHRPENGRSARLLDKLGFEREGLARAYLKINGVWADHVLRSLINPADVDG